MLPATQSKSVVGEVLLTSIVQVIFPNSRTSYSYYSDIPDLKEGDYAIVASPYSPTVKHTADALGFHNEALDGYPTVVRVVSTQPSLKAITKAAKWIIQKINIDQYTARLVHERQVEILQHRIAEEKKKALEAFELAKLRELNPTLGALVDQLAALTGQVIETKPIQVRQHTRKRTPAKGTKAKTTSRAKKA